VSVLTAPASTAKQPAHDYLSLLTTTSCRCSIPTARGVMIPAAHGHPRVPAVVAVLVGGTLTAGGAHAINCWFVRDIFRRRSGCDRAWREETSR
jgi:heme O synthase-like polyprenyltransferase